MKDLYSFVAPYYDFLAKLVFGNDLKEVKTVFLEHLPQKKVLIIGGGDGLDYQSFQSDLKGEYWELSEAMLRKAKKNLAQSQLTFHHGQFKFDLENRFNEVWLHFVLDTFLDEDLEQFLLEIKRALKPNSKIYLADFFQPKTFSQRRIDSLMAGFFRVFTKYARAEVPDYEAAFRKSGFHKIEEKKKRKGWIRAQVWEIAID